MGKSVPAPVGLSDSGVALWKSITGSYELRPDELATLDDICQLTDMIDGLTQAWVADGKPLTTKGSMGQQVTHPMISEIRTHRMARNALFRQMKLPDVEAVPAGKTNQQRGAAQSKWAAAHGQGA